MFQVEMTASVREAFGKGEMRRLRAQGLTPAVVYGAGDKALALQLDSKSLKAQLLKFYRVNTVVTLKIEGQDDKSVLIGEVQSNPVTEALVHADFCEIDLAKEREFSVPVVFAGTPKGVDLGGNQESYISAIVVKAQPLNVPDEIEVDVTELEIDQQLTVADLALPESVTVVTAASKVMVAVVK